MALEQVWFNFFSGFMSTVVGGGFLAFLFFWLREVVFPIPEVTGRWYFEMHTVNSSYNPYKGMVLHYVAMLWREGSRVEGTVEKVYENSSTGERGYEGKSRTRGVVEGYVEKRYFFKDRIFLHIVENGHGRESTNFYDLQLSGKGEMAGIFSSMVANQDGDVKWQRVEF